MNLASHDRPRLRILPERRALLVNGQPAALGSRAFDLLVALSERGERIVAKHELMDLVWPDVVVEENNLQVQISALRRLLGPDAIATVPGRGYRFTAQLDDAAPAISPVQTPPRPTPQLSNLAALPSAGAALIGRDADLHSLDALLQQARLVTLVGTGGIGKTRLALACAERLRARQADGVWFADLAQLPRDSDADAVAAAVARALDLRVDAGQAGLDRVCAVLREQRLLLLLDNCEHVLAGAATFCAALLRAAPALTLLATSQEPLHLADEQVYRPPLLALPADADLAHAEQYGAVALFVARAQAASPRFALDQHNRAGVVDLCRQLDGLPLAIELAAARVALLGVEGLRSRLGERLRLLTGARRDATTRQQTLRASLEWTQGLLGADEQAVYRRLGVFVGGFTMELAQRVAADASIDRWAVLDHLASLVDKSLVAADAADPPRYSLLESAREFALEQLERHAETAATQAAHAAALHETAAGIEALFFDSDDYGRAQTRFVHEFGNLRTALAWARQQGQYGLAVALLGRSCRLWNRCGLAGTASELFAAVAEEIATTALPPADEAAFWLGSVIVAAESPRPALALAADRCTELWRGLADARRLAHALAWRAIVQAQRDNLDAARADLAEAQTLEHADWPHLLRAWRLTALCGLHMRAGELDAARTVRQSAIALARASGDHPNLQFGLRKLADADLAAGDFDALMRSSQDLIDDARDHGPLWAGRLGQGYQAVALIAAGRLDEAEAAALEALPAWRAAGWTAWLLDHLVALAAARGQVRGAAQLLGHSDRCYTEAGRVRRAAEQHTIDAALATLRRQLDGAAIAQCRVEGAALDEPAAVSAALGRAGSAS